MLLDFRYSIQERLQLLLIKQSVVGSCALDLRIKTPSEETWNRGRHTHERSPLMTLVVPITRYGG